MDDPLSLAVEHGYPILFGMLLVSGLGVPIPEDVPLVAAGVLANHGGLTVWEASLACGCFVLSRDCIVFYLGRRYGRSLLASRWGALVLRPKHLDRAEERIRQHPNLVVFVGRFLPGLRSAVFFAAGTSRIHPGRFLAVDTLAALASLPLFIWMGYFFAANIETLRVALSDVRTGLLVTVAVALVLVLLRLRRDQGTARGSEPDADGQES
ncbi:MAG: DedA family protein [Deltaproteobacteria bacterium]|nr:DedA family protein [Deltaproteobacteria bacterium]